ncbi:hypothetical protein SPRG_19807 [Saprolegnia parasitica CBS 223.65]|uniref:Uncharacterized protein n=1 Tax=Saprolegnia parasitica (strain CBS 223.65) TaxID=695850 RepID=A0A067CU03_SAPPC|nr:hypothetical protein SPRG_19807 [Saprolegnia parasitica CBS 223.65]KDO30257.1 hypothetical protein SPRG_19807 [Saprolegnia parasitica CBS 223.65]|eukprot:XP_012199060.1 hypothetical protein SPRG_19807 [Saprolegnia parasitica CBS 223.65]
MHAAPRGSVAAPVFYFARTSDDAPPFASFGGKSQSQSQTPSVPSNVVSVPRVVQLQDLRGHEAACSLDEHGFQAISDAPPLLPTLLDAHGQLETHGKEAAVKDHVEALLAAKWRPSEEIVYLDVFTVTFRSADASEAKQGSKRRPSPLVHVDQTPATGAMYTAKLPPELRDLVENGTLRLRILSVWQPLVPVVLDWPLALAESSSCPETRLVSCKTRFPSGYVGAMALVQDDEPSDALRWWYWSGMQPHEALWIQNFDSSTPTRSPHTSFRDPRVQASASTHRKSAEARVVLVTKAR